MANDKNGVPLREGDKVILECVVESLFDCDDCSRADLKTVDRDGVETYIDGIDTARLTKTSEGVTPCVT